MKFVCSHCNRRFGVKQGIVTHLRRTHSINPGKEGADFIAKGGKVNSRIGKKYKLKGKTKGEHNVQILRFPCWMEVAVIASKVKIISISERL
jgi:hypothetical protein